MGKPKPEKPTICPYTRSATSRGAPRATAPSTNFCANARIASSERRLLIARRSPSASPGVKPANAIATSITWSWKTIAPSVSLSTGSSDGCSYGTS